MHNIKFKKTFYYCLLYYSYHLDGIICIESDNRKAYPSKLDLEIDQQAVVLCNSIGFVHWFFKSLRSHPISSNNVLIISNIQSSEAGTYYCYGTEVNRHFVAKAKINVYGKCSNAML